MSDLTRGHGGVRRPGAGLSTTTGNDVVPFPGRHAFDEDAVLTPIFHALSRSGWRGRQHEPAAPVDVETDPVDAFRRDPLTAPIPMQALAPVQAVEPTWRRSAAGAHAKPEPRSGGRHHRRLVAAGGTSRW